MTTCAVPHEELAWGVWIALAMQNLREKVIAAASDREAALLAREYQKNGGGASSPGHPYGMQYDGRGVRWQTVAFDPFVITVHHRMTWLQAVRFLREQAGRASAGEAAPPAGVPVTRDGSYQLALDLSA